MPRTEEPTRPQSVGKSGEQIMISPFTTAWMGENHNAPVPTAAYGGVLILAAVAYTILVRAIVAHEGPDSAVARAIGTDLKGYASLALYAAAIPLAFVDQLIADAVYVAVALVWLVPDRRIESRVERA